MTLENVNAILTFSGGLLVFVAALIPVLTKIVKKAASIKDKNRFLLLTLSILAWLCSVAFITLDIWTDLWVTTLLFAFLFLAFSLAAFFLDKGALTRESIFFHCVFPSSAFVLVICFQLVDRIVSLLEILNQKLN